VNVLYWLEPPSAPADPPRRWSYSALAVWRQCPRRWWLQHSGYPNVPAGSYPVVLGAAAVHGRLVHAALEAERASRRDATGGSPFQARRFLKQALRSLLDGDIATNPRLDPGRIEAAVAIDECVATYFALRELPEAGIRPAPHGVAVQSSGPPRDAQEYWIEVEAPPFAGRIDEVRNGIIVDFKTGEEDLVAHGEQLRLYAALWWLRFGEFPAGLEIRYPGSVHAVAMPDAAGLLDAVQKLVRELAAISAALGTPPPPARPEAERCSFCPVRQLCEEYWDAPETQPLRTPPGLGQGSDPSPPIRDMELMRLPKDWSPDDPLAGIADAVGIGPVSIALPRKLCPDKGSPRPSGARLLRVLLLAQDNGLQVRTINGTEVFWKTQQSSAGPREDP